MDTRTAKKRRARASPSPFGITTTLDPFVAVKAGYTAFFERIPEDILRNARDRYENSVLSTAAAYGQLECCELIYKRCPSLLYHKNVFGTTALIRASFVGKHEIVRFLIDVSVEEEEKDAENMQTGGGDKLLMMSDTNMRSALHHAVQKEHLECVKLLVKADENYELLRMVDIDGNTAMHLAVKMPKFQLVELLIKPEKADSDELEIKPDMDISFDYAPNVSGETPLLIAFEDASSSIHSESEKIMNLLLEKQPRQCIVPMGTGRYTLLHYAACKGNLSVIQTIIRLCRESTENVDCEGQNFLHLATKFGYVNAVSTVMENFNIADVVLNKKDNQGNTPLHIAAFSGNPSLAHPLLYCQKVDKTVRNNSGQRAVDVIHFDYDKIKAGVQDLRDVRYEKEITDQKEFDLVVATLIATVSFTAGITVPGGYISDGPHKGTALLASKLSFKIFMVFDTMALLLSLYAVLTHCSVRLSHSKNDIFQKLGVAACCLQGAIFFLVAAFLSAVYAVFAVVDKSVVVVGVLCFCFFFSAFYSLGKVTLHHIHRASGAVAARDVVFFFFFFTRQNNLLIESQEGVREALQIQ